MIVPKKHTNEVESPMLSKSEYQSLMDKLDEMVKATSNESVKVGLKCRIAELSGRMQQLPQE